MHCLLKKEDEYRYLDTICVIDPIQPDIKAYLMAQMSAQITKAIDDEFYKMLFADTLYSYRR